MFSASSTLSVTVDSAGLKPPRLFSTKPYRDTPLFPWIFRIPEKVPDSTTSSAQKLLTLIVPPQLLMPPPISDIP